MLLFDLGVYMLVVGATLLMLVALAHQSLRRPRKLLSPLDRHGGSLMEIVYALASAFSPAPAYGCSCARARSRCCWDSRLLSYAVNLFIFGMGGSRSDKAPIIMPALAPSIPLYTLIPCPRPWC